MQKLVILTLCASMMFGTSAANYTNICKRKTETDQILENNSRIPWNLKAIEVNESYNNIETITLGKNFNDWYVNSLNRPFIGVMPRVTYCTMKIVIKLCRRPKAAEWRLV